MAWLGKAVSLGFVVGPALGGILSRRDLHVTARYGHFLIDSFSVPFFAAAFLGLLTLFGTMRWLPESLPAQAPRAAGEEAETDWRRLARSLGPLLGLALGVRNAANSLGQASGPLLGGACSFGK